MTEVVRRSFGPRRRASTLGVLVILASALVLALGTTPGQSNSVLDGYAAIDCNPSQIYGDAGDEAAADALAAAGYSCTGLFNKPTVDSTTPQRVGELWHKKVGSILQIRIIYFGGTNTGFQEPKLCLDDDTDPINSVTSPGGQKAATCVGNEIAQSFNQGVNNGPSYPPAKAAGVAPEEAAGKFEIAVNLNAEINELFGGTTVGGWNVNIDNYTEALLHFNKDAFSIVGFFQPHVPVPGAFITIEADGNNPVGVAHTFTVTVMQDDDTTVNPPGFVPATVGNVDVTLTNSGGAVAVLNAAASTCDDNQPSGDNLDASGQCTVVFTSNSAGTVTGHATVSLTVGGTALVRQTDGVAPNSDDAVKTFFTGVIRILKNSTKGGAVTTAGAVFSISGTGAPASVTDNTAPDEDPAIGVVCIDGLVPGGSYAVDETSPPSGYGNGTPAGSVNIVAAGGSCPGGPFSTNNTATFTNPPLADIQIRYRDGGSNDTALTSIDCAGLGGTPDTLDNPVDSGGLAPAGWDASVTHTGLAIDPSPRTITCTIVIDP
jgi:hypothetical protein